jgi:hypothetical protein
VPADCNGTGDGCSVSLNIDLLLFIIAIAIAIYYRILFEELNAPSAPRPSSRILGAKIHALALWRLHRILRESFR